MKKTKLLSVFYILTFWIVSASISVAATCNEITLHYHERVPYYVTEGENEISGLIGSQASLVFKKAEIPFSPKATPAKRQMYLLKKNSGCDCFVGWFKNPEREEFAKFTSSIYQDKPQIALARSDNDKINSGSGVDTVLQNHELKILIKEGYSYGVFLDNKITHYSPPFDSSVGENTRMLKKIYFKRGDYFFISPEEADSLIESSEFSEDDFKYITFSNMPKGEKRYIMCSPQVDDDIIQRLDQQIAEQILK